MAHYAEGGEEGGGVREGDEALVYSVAEVEGVEGGGVGVGESVER